MVIVSPINNIKSSLSILDKTYVDSKKKLSTNKKFILGNNIRYIVLGISILCLTMVISNTLAFNFTIICMVPDKNVSIPSSNEIISTSISTNQLINNHKNTINISKLEEKLLFSATAIGTLLGTIPITLLTSKFGVRYTFTFYGLISVLSTFFTPLSVKFGFYPFFLMRTLQGIALATSYPAMGSIVTHWSTLRNSGMYIALLSCHLQFGPIFTMPVSGELCESQWEWPAVYYLQSVLTFLSFLIFFLFFRDYPIMHRSVSEKELKTIQKNKNIESETVKQKVPYGAMMRDISVWGVFASNVGGNLGFQVFNLFGPTYLHEVLNVSVKKTGLMAAFPYILSAILKFIVGPFSDHFTFITAKSRVILFATVSQFSMAFCFLLLAFVPIKFPFIIQTCFTLSTVFSGLNCVGVAKSTQLMSRQFAHVMMAFNAIISSIVTLLLPLLVEVLKNDWSTIFIVVAVIVIVTTILFDVTAEVDPRLWTYSNLGVDLKKKHSAIDPYESNNKIGLNLKNVLESNSNLHKMVITFDKSNKNEAA